MTSSEKSSHSERVPWETVKKEMNVKRYGHRKLYIKGEVDAELIQKRIARHHYDVALCLAALKGVELGQPEILETEEDGVTYVGWEADGFTSVSLVKWKAEPIDPAVASRDDLLLAYDRLSREVHE